MPEQLLKCAECNKTYCVPRYDASRSYNCPRCSAALEVVSRVGTPAPTGDGEGAGEPDPLLGKRLGQCEILEKLGEGGMGAVYKAEHVGLRHLRAVKVLPQAKAELSERAVQRFLREARALAQLEHPNIVKVHNVAEAEEWHYIEMEYVEGQSLQDLLAEKGKLDQSQATGIMLDVAGALAVAHSQGIVHRDIKPANILLDKNGTVRVIDFGLAKSVEGADSLITLEGKGGIGTPSFMSPEQCDGMALDGRSDIYSLGVTYFALVTGELPFKGENTLDVMRQHRQEAPPDPRSISPDLSDDVQRIIAKAMEKKPERRFQTCDELTAALSAVIEGKGLGARTGALLLWMLELGPRGTVRVAALLWRMLCATARGFRTVVSLLPGLTWRHKGAVAVVAVVLLLCLPPIRTRLVDTARTLIARLRHEAEPGAVRINPNDGAEMVWIPGGEFLMGSSPEDHRQFLEDSLRSRWNPHRQKAYLQEWLAAHGKDELPKHRVRVDGVWVYRCEVTVDQFKRFVEATGYRTEAERDGHGQFLRRADAQWQDVAGLTWRTPFDTKRNAPTDHPVVQVSWNDAQSYCQWAGVRLPTEAEWEYAARGGATGVAGKPRHWFPWGSGAPSQPMANVVDESLLRYYGRKWSGFPKYDDRHIHTAPVASYPANGFGLFDMVGNVREWCADWYDETYYQRSVSANPAGPLNGTDRVTRGGFWVATAYSTRISSRSAALPDLRSPGIGFRCVASKDTSQERAAAPATVLPDGLGERFTLPGSDTDQYDNPVVTRGGEWADPTTGYAYEIWLKDPRMEFVFVPAGEFVMGCALSASEAKRQFGEATEWCRRQQPRHRVRITKPLYLAKYEVTQSQWQPVMGSTPWARMRYVKRDRRSPAVYISWKDSQSFLSKLGAGLRFPTEAEWEYACRAGTTSAYCFGDDAGMLRDYAWYEDNAEFVGEFYAHGVGLKKRNAWGLYDMHGNVWEWCQDWFGSYSSGTQIDPQGPARGTRRVFRGDAFDGSAIGCRSAFRNDHVPDTRYAGVGLRPAKSIETKGKTTSKAR